MPIATKDIRNAIKAHLANGTTDLSGSWPNQGHSGVLPYLEATFTGISRRCYLDGSFRDETGVLMASSVSHVDENEDEGNDVADAIVALFPAGSSIPFTGGHVVIRSIPVVKAGYRSGSEWRVPVQISYIATAQ